MRKTSLMIILLVGVVIGVWAMNGSVAQTTTTMASDNEMMGNQVIKDEGYGNADAEYYGSKDDLVNDDVSNDESPQK